MFVLLLNLIVERIGRRSAQDGGHQLAQGVV
jgi:hypothetical protein